jgi:predicted metal-dependent hydrolase
MAHAEFINLPDTILWQRALNYYAAHDWYMVHEALEVLWNRSEGQDAEFYQAFLQAAVSLYHYGNANFSGARQLAKSAISRLADLPDVFHGVDVRGFLNQFEAVLSPVMNNVQNLRPLDASTSPKIATA